MDRADVAIVGGGPAGSACAIVCARAGLATVVLEREAFPREKVCGDCLNPACWPVLGRLKLADAVRQVPHAILDTVEFIGMSGRRIAVDLPQDEDKEIAVKRSIFDQLLLSEARAVGARIYESAIVTRMERTHWGDWKLDIVQDKVTAPVVVAADGRNSTIARLRNLLPRFERERVALQCHLSLPKGFGHKVVLQFLPEGYSGQAPVNEAELNLCVVGKARDMEKLKRWAIIEFGIEPHQPWRTITPLTRAPLDPIAGDLFLIGDAARVVEPFTGEGIYYALRSGELAGEAIIALHQQQNRDLVLQQFRRAHAAMYRGRLWINDLARSAVVSPRVGSALVELARVFPAALRLLTRKIAG
jgi:flavin-dependent dehydrogenase